MVDIDPAILKINLNMSGLNISSNQLRDYQWWQFSH